MVVLNLDQASTVSDGAGHRLWPAPAAPQAEDHTPSILQTYFHFSPVTGCTERREYFTSATPASFLSALTSTQTNSFVHSLVVQGTSCLFPGRRCAGLRGAVQERAGENVQHEKRHKQDLDHGALAWPTESKR